ncbi:ubiquinone/menaquinone biosynthesis methyltransferase [Azospira sp. I13]|uniref:class I SAM-dependent methyltransferase n=1 Tax=Azospira sp. I13 TaxID=1765050 RepID=UPI000D4E5120|nr:class I SAM-dependent methyltransferase [Azospira sp. I13]GBG03255.1 ubiquinone/menaquinone biosynthesis methyltransferase [Azospira sp. I13]
MMLAQAMRLTAEEDLAALPRANEVSLILEHLDFADAEVLELGCGKADKTRQIAAAAPVRRIRALEVDAVQHARNLAGECPPRVDFLQAGAEAIPAEDGSVDIVMMFKSLHHVPVAAMDQALAEIVRVLRPGGVAWISEPVFAGELNEVMRLFHDEQTVRQAAFDAIRRAVAAGQLSLERQLFFRTSSRYGNFADFEARMIRVTHTEHRLSPALLAEVERRFSAHLGPDGAEFFSPQRVDMLIKPR